MAVSLSEAMELYHYAEQQGVCHGVVQDKLWLPGLRKLQLLNESGFLAKFCLFVVNLATGSSKVIYSQHSAHPGTTVRKMVAALFST
ncbi:hypothetical protein ABC733_09360 [Mangrovibacter sp. SLW1]